jgi:rubrerythrin
VARAKGQGGGRRAVVDVRDAENAGLKDIAKFFRQTMEEDSARAARCHELIKQVGGSDQAGPPMH